MIGNKRRLSSDVVSTPLKRFKGHSVDECVSNVISEIIETIIVQHQSTLRNNAFRKRRVIVGKLYKEAFGFNYWPQIKKELKASLVLVNLKLKRKIKRNALKLEQKKTKETLKWMYKRDPRRIITKILGRKGDSRSIASKALHKGLAVRCQTHTPDIMNMIQEARGNIEVKQLRKKLKCLYCGQPATEIDHFKSAVRGGKMNRFIDLPINRVPSCTTCHRAGKDTPGSQADVATWHRERPSHTNYNHPQLKMDRLIAEGRYTETDRTRINEGVVHFNTIHQRYCPQISEQDLDRISTFLETTLTECYTTLEKSFELFLKNEPMFQTLLRPTLKENGQLELTC